MESTTINNVVIIGAGNVATHLGMALQNVGVHTLQVVGKTVHHAAELAQQLGTTYTTNWEGLRADADLYLIAVNDDAVQEVARQLHTSAMVAHTSGSVPMSALEHHPQHGIFYPLQTFSKNKPVSNTNIPFCIEGNNSTTEAALMALAQRLSNNVQSISSTQRKHLHLAAVFACNFSNHMYAIADELLKEQQLDVSILQPLIEETAKKIKGNAPASMQTGPAQRKDHAVMEQQIALLQQHPDYQKLYKLLSESITKHHGEEL